MTIESGATSLNKDLEDLTQLTLPSNPQKIIGHSTIQGKIQRIAHAIFLIEPETIYQLPKPIKFQIMQGVIDEYAENKGSRGKILRYLDPETISELLLSSKKANESIAYEYCKKTGCFFLNNVQSNQDIEKILSNLPQEIKESITDLNLSLCSSLEDLSFIAEFPNVVKLNVTRANSLKSLEELKHLPLLRELVISGCQKLTNLSGLENNAALEKLIASNCMSLTDISAIRSCKSLKGLDFSGCHSISGLIRLGELSNLEKLNLSGLVDLKSLDFCNGLSQLIELKLAKTGVDPAALESLRQLKQDCRITN